MLNRSKVQRLCRGRWKGARSATVSAPGAAAEVKRWSANRKKEVVLRLLGGRAGGCRFAGRVSADIPARGIADRALAGMDAGLKDHENDPLEAKLGDVTRRIGELVMEVYRLAFAGHGFATQAAFFMVAA